MRNRIFARMSRRAPCFIHPLNQFRDRVTLNLNAPASYFINIRLAARIQPDDGIHERISISVDSYRPRPLTGATDGDNVLDLGWALGNQALCRFGDCLPPIIRGLFRPAIRKQNNIIFFKLMRDNFAFGGN